MSTIFKGTKQVQLVREEFVFDPQNGLVLEREFRGPTTAVNGLVGGMPSTLTFRTNQEGPVGSLIVRYPNGDNLVAETPVDRWEIDTEVLDRDGFYHPTIQAEMEAYTIPASYRKQIEDAVENGTTSPAVAATNPGANKIFLELRRGASHFETEFLVLRRQRTISPSYTGRLTLNATSLIYSALQLPVPALVGWTLPTLPSNPPQSQWGYRLRTQKTAFVGNRVEQVHEWVLAAWSTLYYTVATSNFPA